MKGTIKHYSENADHYFSLYNSVDAEDVHSSWIALLHNVKPGIALDIGAGSGRDANWLAAQGWNVVAAEPADSLRELAAQNSNYPIKWCSSGLPHLDGLPEVPKQYDLILLSAVWMHLTPEIRAESLSKIAGLLTPEGSIIITLRFGPDDINRPMYPVSEVEVLRLAEPLKLMMCERPIEQSEDKLKRDDIYWQTIQLKHSVTM